MSTDVAYHRRPIIDHDHDFEPDGLPARPCRSCGRDFLQRYAFEVDCIHCANKDHGGMRSSTRAGAPSLDDVRSGRWTPGPQLAELLAGTTKTTARLNHKTGELYGWGAAPKAREEITVCPGCNKVRPKPVGEWCGGTGCKKQGTLF